MADDEFTSASAPAPAKVDPESLVLRAKPARAIRFKKGAVVGIAALTSVGVVATAWVALKPTALHIVTQSDDGPASAKAPSDTLSALPSSYGEAPKLGPPLPGDLGRPILDPQPATPVLHSCSGPSGADRLLRRALRSAPAHPPISASVLGAGRIVMDEADKISARIAAALERLPEVERRIFLGMRDEGLTYAALATRLGLSIDEVEQAFVTALIALDRAARRPYHQLSRSTLLHRIGTALGLSPRRSRR